MPSAPSWIKSTVASLSLFVTISEHPAQAFEASDGLSWASDSVGYYESFSQNDPVVRGTAKIGGAVATTMDAGTSVLNDIKRVNNGISREQVLVGTVAKYGTQFVMQGGINVTAAFAAPVCALTPVSASFCTGAFVAASIGADQLSDAYREWAESFFDEEETPQSGSDSQPNGQWKIVAGVTRQDGGEMPMDDLTGECESMGATDAYQMVASAKNPDEEDGVKCFSSRILDDTRDYVAVSKQCVYERWGNTEVISTNRAIDEKTFHSGIFYVFPSGEKIESFMVMERCD